MKKVLSFILVIVLMMSLVGCGGSQSGSKGDAIKIGCAAPLTGNSGAVGTDFSNGAKMAVEEYNKKGGLLGKKIELVSLDDVADTKQATNIAQKLVDEKVVGVAGHFTSGTTIPTTPIYNKARIAQVTPASNPKVTEGGFDNVFTLNANDNVQGGSMAIVAVDKLNIKKFAVIHDKQAFGQGVAEKFIEAAKQKGAQITSVNGITPGEVDFKAVITKILSEKPDGVFFGGTYNEGGLILKQLRESGSKVQFFAPDSCYGGEFIKMAGKENAEGAIVSFPAPPLDSTPELKEFVKLYKDTYKQDTILGEYGYDAAKLILQAIEQANSTDNEKIIQQLHKGEFKGTLHVYKFEKNGDLKLDRFPVYEIKNGDFAFKGFF